MFKKLFLLATLLFVAFQVDAQTFSSSYPDLSVKIVRCMRNADVCAIDMILENTGYKDMYFKLYTGYVKIYDDMGNMYSGFGNITFSTSSEKGYSVRVFLPSNVPIKARLEYIKANELATAIRRVDLKFGMAESSSSSDDDGYSMKISDIPIGAKQGSATTSANATSQEETSIGEDVGEIVNSVNEIVNLFKRKK